MNKREDPIRAANEAAQAFRVRSPESEPRPNGHAAEGTAFIPDREGDRDERDEGRRANGHDAAGAPSWDSPDLSFLKDGRRAPPTLPLPVFGPFWSAWIASHAEGKAPQDFVAGGLLSFASALIGNAFWPSPWDGWKEPPVVWIALVGIPSSGKSPAQDAVLDAVRIFEAEMAEEYPERKRQHDTACEAAKVACRLWEKDVEEAVGRKMAPPDKPEAAVEPEPLVYRRLRTTTATPEKMGILMSENPKGLFYQRDELAGWIDGFDSYNKSGERSFWVEAFGGRAFIIDRVKHGDKPLRIEHLSVAILGGIQPDRLSSALLSGDDDGLAARFLYIWPDSVERRRPKRTVDDAPALAALRRLLHLQMGTDDQGRLRPNILRLTDPAVERFEKWLKRHNRSEALLSGRPLSHHGKMPGMVLRLATVFEFLWWAADPERPPHPLSIDKAAVSAAITMIEEYFKPMAIRAFGDAALPEEERGAVTLARWLRNSPDRPHRINVRNIQRKRILRTVAAGRPKAATADQIKVALGVLEDAGLLRADPARDGETPGRKSADYEINPVLWSQPHGG